MSTHIGAKPGEIAPRVLMPGDPLRAKWIAETYLDDAKCYSTVRNMLGFTGRYQGVDVSIQGSGMGMPSASIYSHELLAEYNVDTLIRVGSCGGLQPSHSLGDLIVAISAVPADSTAMHLVNNEPHCPTASWTLVHEAVHIAKHSDQKLHIGPIVSSDLFYNPNEGQYERWSSRGVLAVEMEAAALFTVAAIRGIESGCFLVVSDIVVEGVFTRITDDEMKAAVDRMTTLSLDVATSDH